MQETQVRSQVWQDPLEEEMATHSCILAWKIPWTEEPGGLQSTESQTVRHTRETENAYSHTIGLKFSNEQTILLLGTAHLPPKRVEME